MVCCVFFFSDRGRCRGRGSEDLCKGEIITLALESILGKEKIEEIVLRGTAACRLLQIRG